MATAEMLELMTAEQFGKRQDSDYPEELVRGRIVAMPQPDRRHGYVCGRSVIVFGGFVEGHDLGRVLSNDSGVITERDPDTVRGADVAYYSFARLPRGTLAAGLGPEVPELVVEVCSENDRWRDILEKVSEYLRSGVLAVVVLDPSLGWRTFSAQMRRRGGLGRRKNWSSPEFWTTSEFVSDDSSNRPPFSSAAGYVAQARRASVPCCLSNNETNGSPSGLGRA